MFFTMVPILQCKVEPFTSNDLVNTSYNVRVLFALHNSQVFLMRVSNCSSSFIVSQRGFRKEMFKGKRLLTAKPR